MKIVLALLVFVACGQSAKFPPSFPRCARTDKKCIVETGRKVIPQLNKPFPKINLASFDPLEIKELTIGAGSQAVVNVNQNFKNCKLYGISTIKVADVGFDFDKKFAYGSGFMEELKKVCDYELNGKVLLLPIVGSGHSTILLKNMNLTFHLDYEEVKKDGKTYIHFITQKLTLDPETVNFNFENLFNGDKQLGDNINKVLNDNNVEVFTDVKKGYEEAIGLVVQQVLNNMFAKVSIEEAFD